MRQVDLSFVPQSLTGTALTTITRQYALTSHQVLVPGTIYELYLVIFLRYDLVPGTWYNCIYTKSVIPYEMGGTFSS